MGRLLYALRLAVGPNQCIEDRQHVTAIVHHALKDVFQLWVALGFAVPLGEDGAGYFDVLAQLVGGMATQKQAVKKRRLALRKFKFRQRLCGNELD